MLPLSLQLMRAVSRFYVPPAGHVLVFGCRKHILSENLEEDCIDWSVLRLASYIVSSSIGLSVCVCV